jgi:hypothetical protein
VPTDEKPPPPVHVVPNPNGGWDARRAHAQRASAHAQRASAHAETKAQVADRGREIAQRAGAELIIHNRDGRIASKDSHGRDSPKRRG